MKLISIKVSPNPKKKYVAVFENPKKTVHFGQKGARDYLKTKDEELKKAYIARHRVNENFNNPATAGSLSRYILWGPTTSLQENIKRFKNRFNL